MDNKKVIEIIQAGLAFANWNDEQREAFMIAGEAVKKQIALEKRKPIKIAWENCVCTSCSTKLQGYEKYCYECGEKLDWN